MARELGREGFGAFMFALGLTGALVLCAGFGTDELTAREVARDRSRAGRFAGRRHQPQDGHHDGAAARGRRGGERSATSRTTRSRRSRWSGVGVAIEAISRTWYSIFQAHERLDLVSLSVIVQRTATAVVGVVLLKLGAGVVTAAIVFMARRACSGSSRRCSRRAGWASRADRPDRRRWRALLRAGMPIGDRGPAVRAAAAARRDAAVVPLRRGGGRRSTPRPTGWWRRRSSWPGRSRRRCCRGSPARSALAPVTGSRAATSSASRR